MNDDLDKKTWTPQGKPGDKREREPHAEPPKPKNDENKK